MASPLVICVNIPFCTHRCSYCSLDIHTPPASGGKGEFSLRDAYLEALRHEFASMASELNDKTLVSLLITGGTPTTCEGSHLARVIKDITHAFPSEQDVHPEIILQTLPGLLSADAFDCFRAAGVTWYEFGQDTFDFFEYDTLERPVARNALTGTATLLGYANIKEFGIRLLYGLPGQTPSSLCASIDDALKLGARHVRLEPLPLCAGTPLYRQFMSGESVMDLTRHDSKLPDAEETAALRSAGIEHLEKHGLYRYANDTCFATPERRLRYEELRATPCDYITLGLGGISQVDGLRTVNTRDLQRYISYADDPSRIIETVEDLTLSEKTD